MNVTAPRAGRRQSQHLKWQMAVMVGGSGWQWPLPRVSTFAACFNVQDSQPCLPSSPARAGWQSTRK